MNERQLTQEIKKNEARRTVLFKQKEPIDRELIRLHDENTALTNRLERLRLKKVKKDDWGYVLEHGNSVEKSKFAEKQLRRLGLMESGWYDRKTNQIGVEVCLTKGDPKSLEKTLRGVNTILPYIKSIHDDGKRVDVFEHTCSAHGVYTLIFMKKSVDLRVTVYHNEIVVKSFKTTREALEYVQQYHWYDKAKGCEGDDDDQD